MAHYLGANRTLSVHVFHVTRCRNYCSHIGINIQHSSLWHEGGGPEKGLLFNGFPFV